MGRLERKIRKRLTQETQPFEAWYEAHKDRLSRFEQPQESDLGQVKAKRRSPALVWLACMLALLFVALAVTLGLLFSNRPQSPVSDLTFGEEAVRTEELSEAELDSCLEILPPLANLEREGELKEVLLEDGSLVNVIVWGAMVTENDYYFIEMRMVFNKNFRLAEADLYTGLENSIMIGETPVSYGVRGRDDYGFDQYRVVSEHGDVTAYWTVSSINGEFEEWLQLTFAA